MARFVELRRHTDNDGDTLTADGVAAALRVGAGLAGGYRVAVSTGAQRATQTVGCLLAALGQAVPDGVGVEPGLRSQREDRWRAIGREGERALAVGHSPTNEAAVLGLTGELVTPIAKGGGVLITHDQGSFRVEALD